MRAAISARKRLCDKAWRAANVFEDTAADFERDVREESPDLIEEAGGEQVLQAVLTLTWSQSPYGQSGTGSE